MRKLPKKRASAPRRRTQQAEICTLGADKRSAGSGELKYGCITKYSSTGAAESRAQGSVLTLGADKRSAGSGGLNMDASRNTARWSGARSPAKSSVSSPGGSKRSAAAGGLIYAQVYEIVRRIPRGYVLTYGLISTLLSGRLSAQGVGWALKALPNYPSQKQSSGTRSKAQNKKMNGNSKNDLNQYSATNVPWHRVINASGGLSTYKNPEIPPNLQQSMLEAEGISFNPEGQIDLAKYLWTAGLDSSVL